MRRSLRRLAILIAVLLFAAAGYYLYETLRERTPAEKIAEIIHDEDGRELTPQLKKYLENNDPKIRARAALAIGRIGGKESGPLLFDSYASDGMDVAATAAFALGLTGEKQYAARLLDLAFDHPSKVGAMAVEAAGRLADSSMSDVIESIVAFLSHPSPEVRQAACMALFRTRAKSKGQELIELIRNEPDEQVQVAALYTLARLEVKGAGDVYIDYLADADPFVRCLALRGLGRSGHKQATHYLSIALNDGDPGVVAQATNELSARKSTDAGRKIARKLRNEKDEKLMVTLIDALRRQSNAEGVDIVKLILSWDPPANVVVAAVKYLAAIEHDRAVSLIDSLLIFENPRIRAGCADAYGIIGRKNVIPRLAVLFSDDNVMVRAAAFAQLMKIDSGNAHFYMGMALADTGHVLPVLALEEIKSRKLSSYLPRMNEMMSHPDTVHTDIRRALVDAVGPFISDNRSDTAAIRILVNGILDPEYVVRREAAMAYRELLGEDRFNMVPSAKTRFGRRKIEGAIERYEAGNPYATIVTNKGKIELELFFDVAPLTVMNFIELAKDGFYDGSEFHRVIPNFVVQAGDPTGAGWGGPSYMIRCEYSSEPYRRGTVGMATSGKDTGGSQFFIALSPQPHLEARYTVFGQVLSGKEVVDQIVRGDAIEKIVIQGG